MRMIGHHKARERNRERERKKKLVPHKVPEKGSRHQTKKIREKKKIEKIMYRKK